MSSQSERLRGSGARRAATITPRMSTARTNLRPAKLSGGRSSSPILMNSHVEPQMSESTTQTMRAFIKLLYDRSGGKGKRRGRSLVGLWKSRRREADGGFDDRGAGE